MSRFFCAVVFLSVVCCISAVGNVGWGATLWDESVQGDLSTDRLNPTPLALSFGTNSVIATSMLTDREYAAMSLPPGHRISQIVLSSYVGLDNVAFIGVQAGTTLTEPPTGTNPANLLGYTHFGPGPGNVGTDILDDMGLGFGAIGFTPPLSGPNFTFWMQQTGAAAVTYQMDFNVVPEPGTVCLAALGGAVLLPWAIVRRTRTGRRR